MMELFNKKCIIDTVKCFSIVREEKFRFSGPQEGVSFVSFKDLLMRVESGLDGVK